MNEKALLTFIAEISSARKDARNAFASHVDRVMKTLDNLAPLDGAEETSMRAPLRQVIADTVKDDRRVLMYPKDLDKFARYLEASGNVDGDDPPRRLRFTIGASAGSRTQIKKFLSRVKALKDQMHALPIEATALIDKHIVQREFRVGAAERRIDLADAHPLDLLHGALDLIAAAAQIAERQLVENPPPSAPSAQDVEIALVAYTIFFAIRATPTRHWNIKKDVRETSPFLMFLGRVLSIKYGEERDPARLGKFVIRYIRQHKEALSKRSMDKSAAQSSTIHRQVDKRRN